MFLGTLEMDDSSCIFFLKFVIGFIYVSVIFLLSKSIAAILIEITLSHTPFLFEGWVQFEDVGVVEKGIFFL